MVRLEDPKWRDYKDACGPAVTIPQLLQQLSKDPVVQTNPSDEPWFSLCSSLCHQGDAYTASYAAVPHIVRVVLENKDKPSLNMNFFLLPASIEIARANHQGPEEPKEIEAEYFAAVKQLGSCAAKYLDSEDMYLRTSARAAGLVAEGHIAEAEKIFSSE